MKPRRRRGSGGRAAFADLLPPADWVPAGAPAPMPTTPAAPNPFLEALTLEPPALAKDADAPAERRPPPASADDRKHCPRLKRF